MAKEIVLKSLELSNFRGRSAKIEFGKRTDISGENGIGKSTVMKAWYWLVSGCTAPGDTRNMNLFDNTKELTKDTPKASVKAFLDIDGCETSIERTAEAKFIRKRGTDTYEKSSSDEYTILVDNIEYTATKFSEWLKSTICEDENMLMYLLDGGFFIDMLDEDKRKARQVLMGIVGKIDRSEFKGEYDSISSLLERYSIEDIEEMTKRNIRPLNERIEEIGVLVENEEGLIAEFEKNDFDAIERQIEEVRKSIEDIDERILGCGNAIKPILEQRSHIYDIINEKTKAMSQAKAEYMRDATKKTDALSYEIRQLKNEKNTLLSNDLDVRGRLNALVADTTRLKHRREELLEERDKVKERVFVMGACPVCGQQMPESMVADSKARFEERQRLDLNAIVREGKECASKIEENEEEITKLNASLETLKEECSAKSKEIESKEEELSRLQKLFVPFEATEEWAALFTEIEMLKNSIPEIPSGETDGLSSAKKEYLDKLESLNRALGLKDRIAEHRDRVEKLKEERALTVENIAKQEQILYECGCYRQEWMEIISRKINSNLEDCCFDMWSPQRDGTLVPDVCLKGRDGIRYCSLNFSDQIKVRVELQKLFMKRYGVSLPIFIDEFNVFSGNNSPSVEDYQYVRIYSENVPYLKVNKFVL